MSKQETAKVTLELPKEIVDFIKDVEGDVQKYITHVVMELHVSYIEGLSIDTGEDPETIMNKYGLKPVFKAYGVLPCYYRDP